jgi:hypothetical protein
MGFPSNEFKRFLISVIFAVSSGEGGATMGIALDVRGGGMIAWSLRHDGDIVTFLGREGFLAYMRANINNLSYIHLCTLTEQQLQVLPVHHQRSLTPQ